MGIKRKGDKKEKKSKKKDSKCEAVYLQCTIDDLFPLFFVLLEKKDMNLHISGPIGNVLHVGMQGTALPTEVLINWHSYSRQTLVSLTRGRGGPEHAHF